MRNAKHIVRKGLIAKLNGNITYNAQTVPVYGRVPDDASYPYIMVKSQDQTEIDQNRDSFTNTVSTLIEIVTRYRSDAGGTKAADEITDLVMQEVRTRSANYMDLSADGFTVYTQTLSSLPSVEERYKDQTYYRSQLNLDVRLQEN